DDLSPTMRAMGHSGSHPNAGGQIAVCVTDPVTHTLKADGFDGSEDGTGRGQPIVPAVAYALTAGMSASANRMPSEQGALIPTDVYAFQSRIARNGRGDMGDLVNALTAQAGDTGKGDAAPPVAQHLAVRRLL